MSQRKPVRAAVVVLVLLFVAAFDRRGQAAPIVPQAGDFTTFHDVYWGDPTLPGGALLAAHMDDVYATTSGVLVVGILGPAGYSMAFQSAPAVTFYLPGLGAPAPLTADGVDPGPITSAGALLSSVVALKLNVDFSDAGYLPGTAGIPFGDLFLANFVDLPQLNGMTVRQVLSEANGLLGGGASVFPVEPFNLVLLRLSVSFLDITPDLSSPEVTLWAQEHLRIADDPVSVPEPGALLLIGSGLAAAGFWRSRRRRNTLRRFDPSA